MHNFTIRLLAMLAVIPTANPASVSPPRRAVTIVTVNMAMETSVNRILKEWNATPQIRQADLLLLQEVKEEPNGVCVANRLADALGFRVAYSPESKNVRDRGLAILSRFPLRDVRTRPLKRFDLKLHSRERFVLSATADTPWGPLDVESVHLDTRLNGADRLAQLEPALEGRLGSGEHRVIAGDFNSNPFYWVEHIFPLPSWRSQAATVDAFMRSRGFVSAIPESATTFDYLGMHLDWIWIAGLRSTGYRVLPLQFSDHHAAWTRVEFE